MMRREQAAIRNPGELSPQRTLVASSMFEQLARRIAICYSAKRHGGWGCSLTTSGVFAGRCLAIIID
jgi:hypothetical protein